MTERPTIDEPADNRERCESGATRERVPMEADPVRYSERDDSAATTERVHTNMGKCDG